MKIRIRRIMLPVLFCLSVACLIEIPLGQTTIFGDQVILWDTLFRAIVAVPVLIHFYREDRVFRGKERWGLKEAAAAAALGAVSSVIFSMVIGFLNIPGYESAAQALFTGGLWLQLLVLLVASPLLEEFFFRGVLYQRIKEIVSPAVSGIVTALLFGIFHGNPGQGIYSFFMGLLLAFVMERCQTVKAPVLFHMAANGAALLMPLLGLSI